MKRPYKAMDLSAYKPLFGLSILQFMGLMILIGTVAIVIYELF